MKGFPLSGIREGNAKGLGGKGKGQENGLLGEVSRNGTLCEISGNKCQKSFRYE
jgi:hypothetical protein